MLRQDTHLLPITRARKIKPNSSIAAINEKIEKFNRCITKRNRAYLLAQIEKEVLEKLNQRGLKTDSKKVLEDWLIENNIEKRRKTLEKDQEYCEEISAFLRDKFTKEDFLNLLQGNIDILNTKYRQEIELAKLSSHTIPTLRVKHKGKQFILKSFLGHAETDNYKMQSQMATVLKKLGFLADEIFSKVYSDVVVEDKNKKTEGSNKIGSVEISEFLSGGSLDKKMEELQNKSLEEQQGFIIFYAEKIIKLLLKLLDADIIFHDIKASNFLLDEKGNPKIGDRKTAFVREEDENLATVQFGFFRAVGYSPELIPPEVNKAIEAIPIGTLNRSDQIGELSVNARAIVLYALGILLYRMATFDNNAWNNEIIFNDKHSQFNAPIFESEQGALLRDIIQSLLHPDPSVRDTVDLNHAFLQLKSGSISAYPRSRRIENNDDNDNAGSPSPRLGRFFPTKKKASEENISAENISASNHENNPEPGENGDDQETKIFIRK